MPESVSLFELSDLLPQLEQGCLTLTPNQRLASRILSAYGLRQQHNGREAILAPDIFSLENWLDQCWRQLILDNQSDASHLMLLSNQQELLLWERIIAESEQGAVLLKTAATAQQVASAYKHLLLWQVDVGALESEFDNSEDSRAFVVWLNRFEEVCQQKGWLSRWQAHCRIVLAFKQNLLPSVHKIVGVGFESIAPLHRKILSQAGDFQNFTTEARASSRQYVSCENAKQEIYAAAVWAKKQLRNDDHRTIAIVVPDLDQQRHSTQQILQEVFEPEVMLPETAQRANPFNLSAGVALLETSLVDAAMHWLSLCHRPLDKEVLTALLQSPFYTAAYAEESSDIDRCATLLERLGQLRQFVISHADLRYCTQKLSKGSAYLLAEQLQDQANLLRSENIHRDRHASDWRQLFCALLDTVGWPGNRQLDSLEYQQFMQWQQCLEQFSTLDEVLSVLSFSEALGHLRALLARQVFQPKTPDSRLQVLGVLEAAGLNFDALWLTSMSDKQWPAAPSPNPFLPYSLQCRLDMPHATAEREFIYGQQLLQRFLASADRIVASYPRYLDEAETQLSPLLDDFSEVEMAGLLGRPLDSVLPMVEVRRRHIESAMIENFDPGMAPALQKDEKIRGGSSILASQSACPFRAFARHRLHIQALPEPELGLTAADRGSLLHRALELLWKQLKTQQQLLALDEKAQQALCEQVVSYACTELQQRKPKQLGNRLKILEQQRLEKLLANWLSVERERSDFVVKHLEYQQKVRFSELEITLRIDRIDQLSDGSWLLLDYKSGQPSVQRWWGERPEEPQLPLYANLLAQKQKMGGIAFAQVRAEQCVLKGVGDEELSEQSLRWNNRLENDAGVQDWPQLMQNWQQVLEALVSDFIAGKADVDPKQRPKTCEYCELANVCRVDYQQEVS